MDYQGRERERSGFQEVKKETQLPISLSLSFPLIGCAIIDFIIMGHGGLFH